jgi:plastocyanin
MRERRTLLVCLVIAVATFVPAGPASADSGGACYGAVTDAHGTRVVIRNMCFTPTVVHVRPGATVTWVNRDVTRHTVTGANQSWGTITSALRRRQSKTFEFSSAGVYPYFCSYHIGMVGAVVVGNGRGPGAAATDSVKAVPASASLSGPPGSSAPQGDASWGVLAVLAVLASAAGYAGIRGAKAFISRTPADRS